MRDASFLYPRAKQLKQAICYPLSKKTTQPLTHISSRSAQYLFFKRRQSLGRIQVRATLLIYIS